MRISLGNAYAFLFGWPVLAKVNKGLFYLSARALGLHNYSSDKISGETRAIAQFVKGVAAPVVFDVGANTGDWTAAVLAIAPASRIHAFEPQASLATQVATRHSQVKVNSVALGETPGELSLYDYEDHPGSQHASLLQGVIDGVHRSKPRETVVPVTTLDSYCLEHNVATIDLLKIDVEGFELNVLRGAKRLLEEGRIAAIQFEFNEMNVVGRTFLNDFMKYMQPAYRLYRVLPHGLLPLSEQNYWFNEQFIFQNIIAVRKQA